MSKQYGCLPSVILGIEDSYTAFCFNEACCEILAGIVEYFEIEITKEFDRSKSSNNIYYSEK